MPMPVSRTVKTTSCVAASTAAGFAPSPESSRWRRSYSVPAVVRVGVRYQVAPSNSAACAWRTPAFAAPAALPAPGPLEVIHHDADLLVVHKPAGLLVHRSALDAHEHDTALDRLRAQFGGARAASLAPARRLDKGTSGLLVFATHAQAARALGEAFEGGRVRKRYLALVRGWPAPQAQVDHPLARDPELPSAGQPRLPACTCVTRLARVEWPFAVDSRHPTSRSPCRDAGALTNHARAGACAEHQAEGGTMCRVSDFRPETSSISATC